MKIRRFVARDMKTALAQIKDDLGEDAVIMSNKKIAEGVELMAAVDFNSSPAAKSETAEPSQTNGSETDPTSFDDRFNNDVVSLSQPAQQSTEHVSAPRMEQSQQGEHTQQQEVPADSLSSLLSRKIQAAQEIQHREEHKNNQPLSDIEQQFKDFTSRLETSQQSQMNDSSNSNSFDASQSPLINANSASNQQTSESVPVSAQVKHNESQTQTQTQTSQQPFNADIDAMQKEMASIRTLLEHQLSGLMWQDMAQRAPMRAVLINRLMEMGITENVADQIAGYIPAHTNEEESWQQATQIMSQQLRTTNNEIIHQGGIFSLVGPTGVGKTTTIAKLAARFAQIHGADNVVLISTDSYRIAGFEQLSTYGRIIGCDVKLANDAKALDDLLQHYSAKKLILIDTAGMGQRDMRLAKQLTTLVSNARVRIKNYLVLSANTQARVMQENVDRFKAIPLSGCIYTKLDESLSVGEILATAIQNGLPIGYLTDGQRVPEDIKVANAEKLVTLADRMAKKNQLVNPTSWRSMPRQPASVVS